MRSPLIVALDVHTLTDALALASRLDASKVRLKVGKELFTAVGPAVVEALQQQGFEIFLDLKFHDIPNTVAGAVASAARLGVWMVKVHDSGGLAMMQAARQALEPFQQKPLLTAVTVLTSFSEQELAQLNISLTLRQQVEHLARLAQQAGLDGVVCSAQEASMLRAACGEQFALVTPGIRPADAATDDQVRTVTPAQALAQGSSHLVIGRPITRATDPAAKVDEILQSIGLI